MATITGTVKFFNTTKGFGFISPEGGGKDAFVHISAVQQSGLQGLYENDKVTYDIESGRDGKESAVNLRVQWEGLQTDCECSAGAVTPALFLLRLKII